MTKRTLDALLAETSTAEGKTEFGGNVELVLAIECLKLLFSSR